MNCECISKVEKEIVGQSFKGCEITSASLVDKSLSFPSSGAVVRTNSTLEVILKGKSKAVKAPLIHQFCPFCGVNQQPAE